MLSRKVGFNDELIESDILDSILAVDLVLEVQDVYGCMITFASEVLIASGARPVTQNAAMRSTPPPDFISGSTTASLMPDIASRRFSISLMPR